MESLFLLIVIFMILVLASSQIPPGLPVIDGPQVIVLNSQITLTCTSSRGSPTPTVKWFFDGTEVTTGISTTIAGTAVTTSFTFTASKDYHLEVVECQAENGLLQNPLSTAKTIEVHFAPESPTLTGPTILTPGQQGTWKCISANGFPAGIMTMRNRNKNTQFTTEFASISVLDQKSYVVTGTLTWSPVIVNNGDTICCDVTHTTTLGSTPQTVCRQITVAQPFKINAPVTQYNPILQSTVTLQCAVTQGTAFQIKWLKDKVQLNINTNSRLTGGTVATESLTITNVQQSDGGNYVCRGIDAVTDNIVNTDTINVDPIEPFKINAPVTQYNPILQSTVTLQCAVTQGTAFQIKWLKDKVQLNINTNSRLTGGTVATESLTITNVQQSDGGNYVCRGIDAVTDNIVNTDTINVDPIEPFKINAPVTQYNPILQSTVTLQCAVTQGTAFQIKWLKDKVQLNINTNSRLTGGTVATESLTITNVQQSDGGNYVCRGIDAVTDNIVNTDTINVDPIEPIKINAPVTQYNPILQSTVTLQCAVTQGTAFQIKWLKDKVQLNINTNSRLTGGTVATESLTITNVQQSDGGNYVCRGIDAVTDNIVNTDTINVDPIGTPPITSIPQMSYTQISGQQIILGCTVQSPNSVLQEVQWTFTNNQGQTTDPISVSNSNGKYAGSTINSPSLTINTVASTDQGKYSCKAMNLVGTSTNNPTTSLTVTGSLPVVQINPSSYTVTYGSQLVINCNIVSASPAATQVYWQRSSNNQILRIDNGDQGYQGSTTSTPSLTINFGTTANAGVYTCLATNAVGTGSSNIGIVTVTGGLLSVFVNPQNQIVINGNQQRITCTVSGTPSAQNIAWLFTAAGSSQQTQLNTANSQKYSLGTTQDPFLTVLNFQPSDAGTYVCRATNAAGSTSSNPGSTLLDITVPATYVEPRQYTATVGDASFQIQCLVTATPGATSWYWIFQPVGGSQQTIAQGTNDNQYIVDNSGTNPYLTVKSIALNEAGIYTCYATNSAGTSDGANNPSSRHTLTVTGAVPATYVEPRQYTATVGDASFQIQCLVTANPGATSWYWTFQPVGGSQQTIAQGTNDNQYTVDNSGTNPYLTVKSIALNEAGIYTCYATNSAGTSDGANNPSSRHTLTVTGGGLDITVSRSTYSAIAGDSIVTILCNINGTPPAIAWDWTKTSINRGNSEIISQGTNNARRQVVSSATKPNLNIYSITENDEGIYRCRASNGKQQYISDPITLKVQEASLRKVPGEPQTKSALEVEEGRTIILTCSSTGGNPAPSVVWLKDSMLLNTRTNSSIFGNVTTTTLTFVTSAYDNLEVYECQADNGFLQRPLVKTTYLLFSPSNKPPGQPIITGSQRYDLGDTVTLSCSSTDGNPLPTMNWLRDDNVITTGISRFSGSEVTRITLTFVAGLEDHLEVFECQAHNDYLQNPLASATYIELYFAPRVPTLTGPSTLISGSSGKWTCSSANGYPAPTLSMRIQDRQYTNEITVLQSYDIIDKSYTVAGTLNLVPSIDKTGQDLCCDVIYLFDNNDPQSTCLQLTINDEDEDNIIIYVVIGILAMLVLFVVLLVVMIRYRIGREKGKGHANSKYVSQQIAFSNQQDTADNSTHRDSDRDYEGLDSNRREMHVYNTSQDNVEYSHYSTIPADHVFVEPNQTPPSILKQNSTNLQQDTTYLEPEHSILTPDNVYLEPGQTYFQPKSGNSMTSTT